MNPRYRLRTAADIARVRAQGTQCRNAHLVLYADAGAAPESRLALIVSSKLGVAVRRNKIRRRLREAFRPRLPRLQPPVDLVVIARGRTRGASLVTLSAAVGEILDQCLARRSPVVA